MRRRRSTRLALAIALVAVLTAVLGGGAGASTFTITPGGQAVTVTISTAGTSATASFSGTAGQRVALNIVSSTITLSKVSLLKPNGIALFSINQGKTTRFVDTQVLPSTGTYKLVIDPSSTYTGKMTLRLYNVPPDASGSLTLDGTQSTVTITTPGQNAALTFTGQTGHRVSLRLSGVTTSQATVTLKNPDGSTLSGPTGFATSGAFIDPKPVADGIYTVFLNPKLLATGSITVQAWDVPADTSGTVPTDGTPTTGTTTVPGQAARFTFSGAKNGRVSLSVTATDFTGNVSILKPDSSVLTTRAVTPAAPAGAFIDAQTLPVDGTYTIVVDPRAEATGSLTFSLYSVSPDTTAPITAGGPAVTVTSAQPGQNNYLTFTGTLNQRISVLVENVSAQLDSAKLNVRKPDGTWLLSSGVVVTPAGAYMDVKTLPVAGNYKIFLDPQGASFGSADITLFTVPADVTGSIPANGTATPVTTTAPGQNAKLTFSGAAGQRVSLNLTAVTMGASACCSVKVSILRPDNTVLASKTVGTDGGFFDTVTLNVAGTWKVSVDPQKAAFGSITLTLYTVPADSTVGAFTLGTPLTVTTSVPGQNASRTFSATANQRLSFKVSGVTMASVKVRVTRPDNLSLFTSTYDPEGGFEDPKTMPLTGTYKVTIDPQGASTGSITITIYNVTTDASASAIVGGSGTLTIGSPGQKGKINFTVGGGVTNLAFNVTSVSMTTLSCCIDVVQFQLYQVTGTTATPLGESTFSDAAGAAGTNWNVPISASGSYYILVDPVGESTGSVTISISGS